MERFVPLSRMHWDHEPRTAAVSETSRSIVRSHSGSGTVHGELQHSKNVHCDHEPAPSSPSPPLEERAGGRGGRPFGVWLLEFFWALDLSRAVHGTAICPDFLCSRTLTRTLPLQQPPQPALIRPHIPTQPFHYP